MSKAFPAKEDIQMFIPDDDRSDRWFETLKKFILQIEPTWFQDIKSVSIDEVEKFENQFRHHVDLEFYLPKEYKIFIQNIGGMPYFSFSYKPIEFSYHSISVMFRFADVWDRPYLEIGSQGIEEDAHLCYSLSPSMSLDEAPLMMTRYNISGTAKIADSLRQYLCCQSFLALGNQQFPHEYTYKLKFHMHEPPYELSPEALSWCEANKKGYHEKDECSLEDIGFIMQSQKIRDILLKHNYQKAWFSTPFDQVWLQEDSFCSISRDFDPNDMFDTVLGQICTYNQATILSLIDDFARIGYQCVEKKWRSHIPAFLQNLL